VCDNNEERFMVDVLASIKLNERIGKWLIVFLHFTSKGR